MKKKYFDLLGDPNSQTGDAKTKSAFRGVSLLALQSVFYSIRMVAVLLLLCCSVVSFGQITYFLENFSSYPDGTTSGNHWTTIATDCDDPSPNMGPGISAFGVYDGEFLVNDSEGSPCCPNGGGGYMNYFITDVFDVDTFCTLTYSFQFRASGPLDCVVDPQDLPLWGCAGTSPPDDFHDQIIVEYSINGGPFIEPWGFCFNDGQEHLWGPFSFFFIEPTDTTFQLRISLANNSDDEIFKLYQVKLQGYVRAHPNFNNIGPLCETDPPQPLPTTTSNGAQGYWNVGPTFDPAGHGGETVTIYFTPYVNECAYPDTMEIEVLPSVPISFTPIGPVCSTDPSIALDSSPSGINGDWSGPGVSNNSFSPAAAGPGTHSLVFTPEGNNCVDGGSIDVVVNLGGVPDLGTATLCNTDQSLNLTSLQDPDFQTGTWSGQGVSGSSFDPSGLSGNIPLTFTPSEPCADPSTTNILVNVPAILELGTDTICSIDPPLPLNQLADSDFPTGLWSGPGVSGGSFSPIGYSGQVTLSFDPDAQCAASATTTVLVQTAYIPTLGTASLCSNAPPFNLVQLADPNSSNGIWSGPGVSNNFFLPSGMNGNFILNFTPSDPCVEVASTQITVAAASQPQLGTASLCEADQPLALNTLADPNFPNGTWSGPGVMVDSFDPSGLNGSVLLVFDPLANCAANDSTVLTVNATPDFTLLSTENCDPSNQNYTVTLQISGGTQPYNVNGVPITGSSFTSGPIPNSTPYSFAIGDQPGCGTETVSGSFNCGCPSTTSTIAQTLCTGDTLAVGNSIFTEANPTGTVLLPSANSNGCDSVILVNLSFVAAANGNIAATLCPGETIVVNGEVYDEQNPTGTQTLPNASYLGCDSTVSVSLSFYAEIDTSFIFLNSCDSAQVGSFVQNLSGQSGCDSTVVTVVNLLLSDTSFILGQTCDPSQAGQFIEILSNAAGCDSTIISTITLVASDTTFLYETSCVPANTGTFYQNLVNIFGCDSVIVTNIAYALSDTTLLFQNTCDPGAAGVFVQNDVSQDGCDSITITTILLSDADTTFLLQNTCDPNAAGVFTQNLVNQAGCDSITITTVLHSGADSTFLFQSTCDPGAAGIFTQNLVNQTGCDSVIVTTVTLSSADTLLLFQNTCDPVAAGVFVQNLTNQGGCDSTVITTLTLVAADTVQLGATTCNANEAGVFVQTLSSSSGCDSVVITTVVLQLGDSTILYASTCDPSQVGIFTDQFTNQFGCDSTVLTITSLLQSDTTLLLLETCDPAQVGTSTQILQNQIGCDSVVIQQTVLLPLQICGVELSLTTVPVSCNGALGGISLTATVGQPPFSFEVWQTGGLVESGILSSLGQTEIVDNLPSGDYQIIVTNAIGTTANYSATVGTTPAPQLAVEVSSDFNSFSTSCANASDGTALATGLGGTPPYTFAWSNGSTTAQVEGLGAGIYQTTLTDMNGCTATSEILLTAAPPLDLSIAANHPNCISPNTGSLDLEPDGGVPPYQFALNGTALQTSGVFTGLSAGQFTATVMDANGCEVSETILLNAPTQIIVELGEDITIELGDPVTLTALVNIPTDSIASVTWSNLSGTSCLDCLVQEVFPVTTTDYSISLLGNNGCADQDEITVYVNREKAVYVPNAFSPNDDGFNDIFMIYTKPGAVSKIKSFVVFSRWGETVHRYLDFQPNDPASGWDGTHRGQPLDAAVFTWFAEVELVDGHVEIFKGDITLVK